MHRCSQRERRGSGLEGQPPAFTWAAFCFSAVAELLVVISGMMHEKVKLDWD